MTGEDDVPTLRVELRPHAQAHLVGLPAKQFRVDRPHEGVHAIEPFGSRAGRQPFEITVRTRDVTVRAGCDVDDDVSALRHRLAALIGRYSEAMGVAVIVRDKELGLSVVAIHQPRNGVTELQKTLSLRLNVVRRPVESYALVILRLDRRTSSLIEPEIHPLVMNHASDEATVLPHGTIHGQPKPVPEAQTL